MFTIKRLNSEIGKKVETKVIGYSVKISTNDKTNQYCIMPQKYVDTGLIRIKSMEVYEDDTWAVSFPKCGTTWTQEMLWLLRNDLNYEGANSKDLDVRFPFLERAGIIKNFETDYVEKFEKMPRPRFIKTHLPLFLLPDKLWSVKPKIVYVARNPKDVVVSFYHQHRHLLSYTGTREELINAFVQDEVIYSPFNEHVFEFWKIRNEPNVLFLFYEDMKKDLDCQVKSAIKFLGKEFSQPQIDELCSHLSFDSMRKNKRVNKVEEIQMVKESIGEKYDPEVYSFIRKGRIGSHKEELTGEEIKKLDAYIQHSELESFK